MKKLIFFVVFLYGNLLFSQEKDSLLNTVPARQLTQEQLDFAKAEYIKMLHTEDYKKMRHTIREIRVKVNNNDLPLSNDDKLKEWLTANLDVTKYKSVEEGLLHIRQFTGLSRKLTQDYMYVYELMAQASFEQISEIMEPEFHLTEEDLKLAE